MATAGTSHRDSQNDSASHSAQERSSGRQPDGRQFHGRLKIDATFCPAEASDPFDTVEWDVRSAAIKGENGEVLFEQTNCEVPVFWSQLATNVICSKYFYGEVGSAEREKSVRQLVHRVARTIADWGLEDGYFASKDDGERFYRDLAWLCLHQHGAFNSPVWFNVGLYHQYGVSGAKCNWRWDERTQDVVQPENPYEYPQGSACFIQHVDDNMEDIMELARSEAMLFKFGSGTGTDLSTLRSYREKLSGGGRPSGPLSFMRVYDQIAAVVKSGGKTRRAAKMQSLKVWHPDVMEFIECKWKEEQKARVLIEKGGYEANFNGEAYSSIMFQNANLSVRVTDEFMQAVERDDDWATHWVTDENRAGPTYKARDVLNRMADCAWHCGDPGVQYDTTINNWHTCPNSGRINASNPCVTGDTLVATSSGLRQMEDLVGQTLEIINGQGQRAWVDKVFATGHKPVYLLKTRAGFQLKLTADHRVWTENRGDVPACELTTDDVVRLERSGFGNAFVPELFGELVGATGGEGLSDHGDEDPNSLSALFGAQETLVAERLRRGFGQAEDWLASDGGDALQVAHATTARSTTAIGHRSSTSTDAVLAKVREFATLDQDATTRTFTNQVYDLDRPSQAALLRGLFTARGAVVNYDAKSRYVALDSSSLPLLRQVQLMLLGFGIKGQIYENRRALDQASALLSDGHGGIKSHDVRQIHSLRIARQGRVDFEQQIGLIQGSRLGGQLAELNAQCEAQAVSLTDRVASLTPCGEADVYDLTEPVSSHFVAGGMVVHNCSEYMFLDDTACNLSSINLMKFRRDDGTFDSDRFRAACRVFFIAQEILVDHASYPTRDIARNSHAFRPLGLGYSNLGSLLMSNGVAYDSDEGHGVCGAVTALLHGQANLTSAELAEAVGPFAGYEQNREPMLRVMQMHRDGVESIQPACPAVLTRAAREVWDEVLTAGRAHGFRNAQATVLAPTGTISFMMDCDTTGIEPEIALVKYKQLAGGGMLKIVNQTVPLALRTLGYSELEAASIVGHIDRCDTIEGAVDLHDEHLPVFDCAFTPRGGVRSIRWNAHVAMMAAAQPFLSGAISKTVNMPRDVTPDDIAQAYADGWKMGLKALAIYRDGSKESQPLSTSTEGDKAQDKLLAKPRRERLPDTRESVTHKFSVAGHEGYITVGLFPDGRPGELFITMAKEGSTVGGLMDAFGTSVSMSLQYGVPLADYVSKFSHMRFEPQGHTKNPDIRIAKSLIDYIFRWLGIRFIAGYRESQQGYPAGDGMSDGADGRMAPSGDTETETMPVATKAGGQSVGQEAAGRSTPSKETQPKESSLAGPTKSKGFANGQVHGRSNGAVPAPKALQRGNANAMAVAIRAEPSPLSEQFAHFQVDAPSCDNCGSITVRNGNCYLCHNCGNSMGCS